MRPPIVISVALALFITCGVVLDRITWFDPVREVMHTDSVSAGALKQGPLGEVLRGNGFVHPAFEDRDLHPRWGKLKSREVYRLSDEVWPVPDSAPLATEFLHDEWPLISIAVDERDLKDPKRGIFSNWQQAWERPAHASYFEGRELLGTTRCGIRLHGHSTRMPRMRDEHGASLRLYFRDTYGAESFPQGLIFEGESNPKAHLIVRGESAVSSALSFDIVRRIGGHAPEMRPALFVLNGELQGLYSLSEHLTKRMWSRRLGHNSFAFHRSRSPATPFDINAYEDFREWVQSLQPGEFTWERVSERVDIDALVRHLFPILWCGTDDWAQGAAILDRSEDDPVWRWVNWDMDRSFRPSTAEGQGGVWRKDCFDLILGENLPDPLLYPDLNNERQIQRSEVRGRLFGGLLRDDEEFRRFLVDATTGYMNHELNSAFLRERLSFYRGFEGTPGIGRRSLETLEKFLRHRSRFFRQEFERVLGLEPSVEIEVTAPEGVDLLIDGRFEPGTYRGHYFPGQVVHIEVATDDESATHRWRIDAQELVAPSLQHEVSGAASISLLP